MKERVPDDNVARHILGDNSISGRAADRPSAAYTSCLSKFKGDKQTNYRSMLGSIDCNFEIPDKIPGARSWYDHHPNL